MAEAVTEASFREEASDFLEANAKLRVDEVIAWGEGSDKVGLFAERSREQELADVEESKRWRQKVFDAGQINLGIFGIRMVAVNKKSGDAEQD